MEIIDYYTGSYQEHWLNAIKRSDWSAGQFLYELLRNNRLMKDWHGEDSRIYRMDIQQMDYSGIIGQTVCGTIDRPFGSAHPRHPDMIYPINYGYVDGVLAGDGAEQDVYVFGAAKPIHSFTGKVVAVLHRLNDCEDKWIVSADGKVPDKNEILQSIDFQEQYFMGELYI